MTSGRPIMLLLDLLGRRWCMRVIWELRAETATFRALQERCEDVSSSVLAQRLKELRAAGIVELTDGEGYALTTAGRELLSAYEPLGRWADRWGANRI